GGDWMRHSLSQSPHPWGRCPAGQRGQRRAEVFLAANPLIGYAAQMTVTVRFAPSPTGYLHIGNARTALFNWLFAQKHGGRFVQRFDDTDQARSTQEFAHAILYDLYWLGTFPDETHYQSRRFERYAEAADRPTAAGLLYPCY